MVSLVTMRMGLLSLWDYEGIKLAMDACMLTRAIDVWHAKMSSDDDLCILPQ